MIPYYSTQANLELLYAAAKSWCGTPFRKAASVKGAGIDCVHLAREIYAESGFELGPLPASYSLDGGRHLKDSKITSFIKQAGRFELIAGTLPSTQPGDLILFRIGRTEHHAGIKLSGSHFIQSIRKHGTIISDINDPTWASRYSVAYRPI